MPDPTDPNFLFAAERTLLAWNRTSISLMTFGFFVERFGMFLEMTHREEVMALQRHISFSIGISFVLLASFIAIYSAWQYRRTLKSTSPSAIPPGINLYFGMITNGIVALLGAALTAYLARDIM